MANFVVSIVLLYEIGVVGSAIGADVAYLIYVPAHFWICKRMIGLPVRPVVVTLARMLVARARWRSRCWPSATTSCRCWTGSRAAPPGVVAYCVALLLTGEVSRSELASVRRAVAARFG